MTQLTGEQVTLTDYNAEPVPVEMMPAVAEQLAWHEEQLKTVPNDLLAIAQYDKQRLIDRLLEHRPGETLINEITYLSTLYENRSVVMNLADGSSLRTWGTRDPSNHVLDHRYYVQQRTDGELRYRVISLDEDGRTVVDLNDQGELGVTKIHRAKQTNDFRPYRPQKLDNEAAVHQRIRTLFDSSLLAASVVKSRDDAEALKADRSALELLPFGPIETKLETAASQEDIDAIFTELCNNKPIPYEMLEMTGLVTIKP